VTLIDTGGLGADGLAGIQASVASQAQLALDEADAVVLVLDARAGLTAGDRDIADGLRRRGASVVLAINKMDGIAAETAYEFAALGFEDQHAVAAAHGRGTAALAGAIAARLPAAEEEPPEQHGVMRVAVVGRPNVGKSTLVNALAGEERQVVHDAPGTTRDAIDVPVGDCILIDTAGVRRKGRTTEAVEKFSIVKTLDALARAQVAILVVDAQEGVVEQDLHILDYAADAGAGLILAVNKWDALDAAARERAKQSVRRRLVFAPWIPVRYLSAMRRRGLRTLLADAAAVHRCGAFDVQTTTLNRILARAVEQHPPPTVRSRQIKLRYAHKGGSHPPTVIVHGSQTEALPEAYLRYLAGRFRKELDLVGVPVRIETRTTENPFADRRNQLTRRQQKRRQRMIRHRRGR
jgi:GTP-binding protein